MTPEQRDLYNCPNCGAPIGYNRICPYCGTRLRWEPYPDTLEFKYTCVPVRNAEITAAVPIHLDIIGQSAPYVIRELVQKASAFVVEHIRVKRKEDRITGRVIYSARVGFADLVNDFDRGEDVRISTNPSQIVKENSEKELGLPQFIG